MTRWQALRPVIGLFWRTRRTGLAVGTLLAVTTILAGVALLGLSGWFIAASALAGASTAAAIGFDVFRPAAAIRAFALIRTAGRYGERLATHDATLAVVAALRVHLFRGWAEPGAAHALLTRPARLLHRITCDVDALDGLYLRVLLPLAAAVAAWLAIALALGLLSPALGAAVLLVLLMAGGGLTWWTARASTDAARRRAHAAEALRVRAIDLLAGQADWIMTGRLAERRTAVLSADVRLQEAEDALHRIETRAGFGFSLIGTGLLAGTLLAAGMLVEAGMISVPLAVLAILLAVAAVEPFGALRRLGGELGRTVLAARRLGPRIMPAQSPDPVPCPSKAGDAVTLRRVTVRHPGSSVPALREVSLTIANGERVALIGPSGAGKSTLLAVLAGDLAPLHGTVQTRASALLPQRTALFHDTVRGNLLLADPTADTARLLGVVAAAGLEETVAALPQGLDTPLGEGGSGLSTGQSRRLALARLLLRDSPLWLLDEPTDGLEDSLGRDIMARIAAAADGRTIFISTHLQREAALADRLVVIEKGQVFASFHRGEDGYAVALARLRAG